MYYLDIFKELNKSKVRYLVVGGVAVVLHGVVRLTADLDLIVNLKTENLLKFLKAMKKLGYSPKIPVKTLDFADPKKRKIWITEKNMRVFSFRHLKDDYKIIDVFVEEPIPFDKAYRRKRIIKVDEVNINIISFDDLILLKKLASRPQDLFDIKMLIELRKEYEKKKK